MQAVEMAIAKLVGWVWGPHMVLLLCGMGIYLTIYMGFPQFKGFLHAIKVIMGKYDKASDPGEISHFQALTTALSATVGLGNIAGVAVAIAIGGPGATFWMLVVGFLGMATKYTECSLAILHRRVDKNGEVHGGPMHYIEQGLGSKFKPLAIFYAIAMICATFGAGNMFQSNQVAQILKNNFHTPTLLTGIVLSILTAVVIIGGIKRIGQVTSKLVPFMGAIYVLGSLFVIFSNISELPALFALIFKGAFTGTAAVGGFTGVVFREVLRQGVQRACFSNEAGLGSAAVAHSAAATKEPIREGVVALLGPFVDTILICTMTALVILLSGAWMDVGRGGGVLLTAAAFDTALPGFGHYFVPVAVTLFAYSTLLSWSYYGERALDYITNGKYLIVYKLTFCLLVLSGAVWKLDPVLNLSDALLGFMVVPNAIAILAMSPRIRREGKSYFRRLKEGAFD